MELAEELIKNLTDKNNKIKHNRNFFKHKIYPFFTREPERAKFNNGFHGVLGAVSRLSLDFNPVYDVGKSPISHETLDLDFNPETLREDIIHSLTSSSTINSMNHPLFINYIPVSDGKDYKGEVEIASLLIELTDLKSNAAWKKSVGNRVYTNLLEKVMIDSLIELREYDSESPYVIFNKSNFALIEKDLNYLAKKNDFFIKNIHNFFAFYYFQYVAQTIIYLNNFEKQDASLMPLYFTLESEKITSSRQTVKQGYNIITSFRKDLLTNDTIIGYLNFLIESKNTYSIQEILNFSSSQKTLLNERLLLFIQKYGEVTNDEDLNNINFQKNSLLENINILKRLLNKNLQGELKSRFFKSVDEIGNLSFLKSRGQLGKILNLNTETIILLTALIVKDERMILSKVFEGFELRGVWLDRYTKEEVVNLYERMNILDKKSDSGEAKYVKPIL